MAARSNRIFGNDVPDQTHKDSKTYPPQTKETGYKVGTRTERPHSAEGWHPSR